MKQNIPKGWRMQRFGEVINENNKSSIKVRDAFTSGGFPFFSNGEKVLNYSKSIIDGKNIFMNTGGMAGVKFFDGDAAYSTDIYSFESKDNTKYLYYLLLNSIEKINEKFFSGSGLKHLQKNNFKNFEFIFPRVDEQEKIVDILSTVDEEIQKADKIISHIEKLKKGLLRNIFKKNNLVFLDRITNRGSGHTPNKQHPEYWNGSIKWVSLADSNKLDNRYITKTDKEISTTGIERSSAVFHTKNTVIVCRDAAIGRVSILGEDNMAVSQHFIAWQCGEKIDFKYLYYWLQSQSVYMQRIATGTTIKTIGLSFFKKLQIPLPNITEQIRVGVALWAIDDKISVNKTFKKKLIQLKKGLMQDLLSGKIIVKIK